MNDERTRSERVATRLWWQLRVFGVDVAVLDGGLAAWRAGNHPVETGEVEPRPVRCTATPRRHLVADVGEVARAAAGNGPDELFLALDEAAVPGDGPPCHGDLSRIPGSRSLPVTSLTDPRTGRFLPVEELRDRLASAGVLAASRPVVCDGDGVAGALVAFASALAGGPDVALHDGASRDRSAQTNEPENARELSGVPSVTRSGGHQEH